MYNFYCNSASPRGNFVSVVVLLEIFRALHPLDTCATILIPSFRNNTPVHRCGGCVLHVVAGQLFQLYAGHLDMRLSVCHCPDVKGHACGMWVPPGGRGEKPGGVK